MQHFNKGENSLNLNETVTAVFDCERMLILRNTFLTRAHKLSVLHASFCFHACPLD